ncbi:MAG: competence/damage-inducible protein A [Desulfobacterales bacterium]|jgi:nicotinamide-nucleotide amidase
MQAVLLATGDEIRTGAIIDTNSAYIAEKLEMQGVAVYSHLCVGDRMADIRDALATISRQADVAVVTGGLGPTADDRTAEAAAAVAGVGLHQDPDALENVTQWFEKRGLPMNTANRKQALMPEGAVCLPNPVGTAPGFVLTIADCQFFFLPGVPREMKVMLDRHVLPALADRRGGERVVRQIRVVSTFGLPESAVGEKVRDVEDQFEDLRVGLRVVFPEIHVRLYGRGEDETEVGRRLEAAAQAVRTRLERRVLSMSGLSMAAVVGELLLAQRATLAVAESCTGGLIAKQLTDVPGSSGFFVFSGVTYANDAKVRVLGVDEATLNAVGAVHEDTALAMAEGARRVAAADYAIATTGIAGPDGGTADKPVGTVCIGLATPESARAWRYVYPFGDRDLNRRIFAAMALDRLRQYLQGRLVLDGTH